MERMNEWLSLAIGTGIGAMLSWLLTHLYYVKGARANDKSIAELKESLAESRLHVEELRAVNEHNERRRRVFDTRAARFARYEKDESKTIAMTVDESFRVILTNVSGADLKQVTLTSMPYTEHSPNWNEGFLYQDTWPAGERIHFNSPEWFWESDGIGVTWFAGHSYPQFTYIPFDPSKSMAEYRVGDEHS